MALGNGNDITQACKIEESTESLSLLSQICKSLAVQRERFKASTRLALAATSLALAGPVSADVNNDLVHQAVLTEPGEIVEGFSNSLRGTTPELTEDQQEQIDAFEQRLTGFYNELIAITELGDDILLQTGIQTRRAIQEFLNLDPMSQSAVIDTFYANGGNVSEAIMEHTPHLGESRQIVDQQVGEAFFDLMPRLLRNFEGVPDVMDRSQIDSSVTANEYTQRLEYIHENSGMYLAHVTYLLDRDPNFEFPRISEEQYYAFVDAMMNQDGYEGIDRRFFPAFNQIMTEQAGDISSRTGDYIEANLGIEEAVKISPLQFGELYSARQYAESEAARAESEAARAELEATRAESEADRLALVNQAIESARAAQEALQNSTEG